MTEDEIACALTRPRGPFPYRRYLCVPNLSWGLDIDGEADLVALSAAGYLTEVEIKISVSDFRRDAGKWKHRKQVPSPLISAFYYAIPAPMWPKVEAEFPFGRAGLILVDAGRAVVKQKAPARPSRKLTDAEIRQLGRLGTMRYWTRISHKTHVTAARPADE